MKSVNLKRLARQLNASSELDPDAPEGRNRFPDTWIDQRLPNPGSAVVFGLGLPMLVVDQHGGTHVVRTSAQYRDTRGDASAVLTPDLNTKESR
ncbi:hypothetical protein [Aeromicrobium sp. JJY06]|uniref:hypothetical protein n=1 Tax=Aeromicrobium sp. JJY06 TaxID=3373478 RepID=UPI00376EE364